MSVNTCSLAYNCTFQTASGWILGLVRNVYIEKMSVDFQEQSPDYPSNSCVKPSTNTLTQSCRWTVHSPQVLWDLQQTLVMWGLPPKLQVGTSTHPVMHGQCVGWNTFCSPALNLHMYSEMVTGNSHSWFLCYNETPTRIFECACQQGLRHFLVKCDSISTTLDSSLVKTGLWEFIGCSRNSETINVRHWHYWFCRNGWLDNRIVLLECRLANICQRPVYCAITAILLVICLSHCSGWA